MTTRKDILEAVNRERDRQDAKFGKCPRNIASEVWLTILMEEVGEVARAIIEKDSINYEHELIQVAAVAIAAIEDYRLGTSTFTLKDIGCGVDYLQELNN